MLAAAAAQAMAMDSSVLRAEHFIRGGLRAMERGHLEVAEGRFLRARRTAPDLPRPMLLLGHVQMIRGDYAEAEDAYRKAVARYRQLSARMFVGSQRRTQDLRDRAHDMTLRVGNASSASAATSGGMAEARRLQARARMISLLREAEGLHVPPVSTDVPAAAHFFLGTARLRGGRPGPAAESFEAAVALAPDNAQFRYHLALALALSGRLEEAQSECDTAGLLGHRAARGLLAYLVAARTARDAAEERVGDLLLIP